MDRWVSHDKDDQRVKDAGQVRVGDVGEGKQREKYRILPLLLYTKVVPELVLRRDRL